jgi:FkbM family methyltransferase
MENVLRDLWGRTERFDWLRQLLRNLGINRRYHQIREVCLRLRYGARQQVVIEDIHCVFPLTGDVEREFFCQCQFGEEREVHVVRHILKNMRSSRCFVDVGANLGFYSLIAAKAMKTGRMVHAVEMDAENVGRIEHAVKLNGVDNVIVHQLALGRRESEVTYYRVASSTHTLGVPESEKTELQNVQVRMTSLDRLAKEFNLSPDLIKIDVEGAEFEVLKGMTDILGTNAPKVYMEVHLHHGRGSLELFGGSLGDILRVFEEGGYEVSALNLDASGRSVDVPLRSSDPQPTESLMLFAQHSAGKYEPSSTNC